jgi:hypothetical protein
VGEVSCGRMIGGGGGGYGNIGTAGGMRRRKRDQWWAKEMGRESYIDMCGCQ